jgi:cell shape-determining protein MreC
VNSFEEKEDEYFRQLKLKKSVNTRRLNVMVIGGRKNPPENLKKVPNK